MGKGKGKIVICWTVNRQTKFNHLEAGWGWEKVSNGSAGMGKKWLPLQTSGLDVQFCDDNSLKIQAKM